MCIYMTGCGRAVCLDLLNEYYYYYYYYYYYNKTTLNDLRTFDLIAKHWLKITILTTILN